MVCADIGYFSVLTVVVYLSHSAYMCYQLAYLIYSLGLHVALCLRFN